MEETLVLTALDKAARSSHSPVTAKPVQGAGRSAAEDRALHSPGPLDEAIRLGSRVAIRFCAMVLDRIVQGGFRRGGQKCGDQK